MSANMNGNASGRPKRAPVAIVIADTQAEAPAQKQTEAIAEPKTEPRAPRAIAPHTITITEDVFATPDALPEHAIVPAPPRGFPFGTLLVAAASSLFGLWLTASIYSFVAELMAARPELGWLAAGLAVLAALGVAGVLVREAISLMRLNSNMRLRAAIAAAHGANDTRAAADATTQIIALAAALPETAAGRAAFAKVDRQFLSARELLGLVEKDVIAPLDAEARRRVVDAAKRVSIVTAVSPRAVIDIGYVLFENARLIRAIAELYGCKPGLLGFFRLAKAALAHLAVTGVIAMGDTLVQQLLGHGLAARLSARLGEGVLNGIMTARIGIAAMEVARPMPFVSCARPDMAQIVGLISPLAGKAEAK
jgi:putative membrane protein